MTQKTAWFMLHRIRLAMQTETFEKMGGEVEVDETFIGGKARNMHAAKRRERIKGRGVVGKTAVMGLLERNGKDGHSTVRTRVVAGRQRKHLRPHITEHVETRSDHLHRRNSAPTMTSRTATSHGVINHAENLCERENSHERLRELLELAEALNSRNLCERRAVPPVPLPRRAGVQVQHQEGHGRAAVSLPSASLLTGKRLSYKKLTGRF